MILLKVFGRLEVLQRKHFNLGVIWKIALIEQAGQALIIYYHAGRCVYRLYVWPKTNEWHGHGHVGDSIWQNVSAHTQRTNLHTTHCDEYVKLWKHMMLAFSLGDVINKLDWKNRNSWWESRSQWSQNAQYNGTLYESIVYWYFKVCEAMHTCAWLGIRKI